VHIHINRAHNPVPLSLLQRTRSASKNSGCSFNSAAFPSSPALLWSHLLYSMNPMATNSSIAATTAADPMPALAPVLRPGFEGLVGAVELVAACDDVAEGTWV